MQLIGGGAKNWTDFLIFLGEKKAFGSPFQMNFPREERPKPIEELAPTPKRCNDDDARYRCACVDCPGSCPKLPDLKREKFCKVGHMPCISLTIIIIYSVFLFALVSGFAARAAWNKRKENKNDRLRLLQDAQAEGDDDENGELISDVTNWDVPPREYKLNTYLNNMFASLGRACTKYPALTIGISSIIVILMSLGWLRFTVETDPVRLWVAPNSDAAREKAFFDNNFGPFYRAQQAFLVNDTKSDGPSPVLSYDTLRWWFDVEERVKRLKSVHFDGVTFDDVCFKPTGEGCVVQSVSGYFANQYGLPRDTWREHIEQCANQPVDPECLPEFSQPLKKEMVLGGYEKTGNVLDSQAMVVTWVVNNHQEDSEEIKYAEDWENSLKSLMRIVQQEAKERGLRLSYSTEVSLEQELNKSSNTDAKIVVISYIAMFIYASIALGGASFLVADVLQDPKWIFVDSKFTLGVAGIVIVLMSVSAAVGLFSAMNIKVTLIIAEVIPFLVLAIGVDNIFLICHEFEKVNAAFGPSEPIESRVGKALGRMGPSILLSALTEFIAFALGAAVAMPAVRNFAIYAAGAVVINAILQVTMFVAVLALNQKRVESGRVDCLPCIKIKNYEVTEGETARFLPQGTNGTGLGYTRHPGLGEDEGLIDRFVRKTYAPFLLGRKVQVVVLVVFIGIFSAGVALLPKVQLGLGRIIVFPFVSKR